MIYYCILNPSNEHDQFFLNNTTKGVTGKSLIIFSDIRTFIKLLLDTLNSEQFMLHQTNSEKVLKWIKKICNEWSTGFNNTSISLIKPDVEYIPSHLVHKYANFKTSICHKIEKELEYVPYQKWPNLNFLLTINPYQFFPYFQKSIKMLLYHKWQPLQRLNYYIININLDIWRITLLLKIKGNADKAMKCGEITLSVFVYFHKAFDTINLNILITKIKQTIFF